MAADSLAECSSKNNPKDWLDRWGAGDTPWHKTEVNPFLIKYIHLLENDRKNLKIFVPLCGKSLDMKWLFDRGHRVVGVDLSQLAIESFFKENSLEYSVETRNDFSKYTEKSGRITLYCCSLYDFPKTDEKDFDAVIDRGSIGAIYPEDRPRYAEILSSVKRSDCRHFIDVFDYDDSVRHEYPYSLPMSTIVEVLGKDWNVELLESVQDLETGKRLLDKFETFARNFFLVTHK